VSHPEQTGEPERSARPEEFSAVEEPAIADGAVGAQEVAAEAVGADAVGADAVGAEEAEGGGRAVVRAAGGVPWRSDGRGGLEVLVAHRRRRADWSFPKGKALPGEDDVACALREVEEETGLRCRSGTGLGRAFYRDHRGRPKVVRWWAMTVLGGAFAANDEVDEVEWLSLAAAERRLTYATDRDVLRRFEALGLDAGPALRDRPST
jgi:8-oxo-dGTP diphosphatase